MLYHFYEWNHAALAPFRAIADATRLIYSNPFNPLSHTQAGRTLAAMAEVFERTTRVYGKPEFGLAETVVKGMRVPVAERVVLDKTFCRLLHFDRALPADRPPGPRFLVVAPMSGHYATLLRGTVEALLPYADVYITDWVDARTVPLAAGRFGLDDYVDYLIEMLRLLGPDTHVIGVCQPAVPVIMATAVMEAADDPASPASMTLMGGPIDTRVNPTAVNRMASEHDIAWFRDNVVMTVPFPHAGFGRRVYPGFLQLSGFMSMNLDRHLSAHNDFFMHLVKNDGDGATKHRGFYDEYNAVMDLDADFYLETVEHVFIRHSLPKGEMRHRGERIDLANIRRAALLTIEGENDDISGVGQTEAAQHLCVSIPADRRAHYLQPKVGHYGVFNGSRFRAEIAPRIIDFAMTHGAAGVAARAAMAAVSEHEAEHEGAPRTRAEAAIAHQVETSIAATTPPHDGGNRPELMASGTEEAVASLEQTATAETPQGEATAENPAVSEHEAEHEGAPRTEAEAAIAHQVETSIAATTPPHDGGSRPGLMASSAEEAIALLEQTDDATQAPLPPPSTRSRKRRPRF